MAVGCILTNKENYMVRFQEQLSVRINGNLKNDVNEICEKFQVCESDIVRKALIDLVSTIHTAPEHNKYLFS